MATIKRERSVQSDMEAAEQGESFRPSFPILISISVPILYVIGRAYDEYYLSIYGVSAELFPKATQDYLFFAFIGIFDACFSLLTFAIEDWISIAIWALGISAYVGFLFWFEESKLAPGLRSFCAHFRTHRTFRIAGVLSSGPLIVAMGAALLFFIVFMLLLPIYIGQKAGVRVATEEIKKDFGVCSVSTAKKDTKACVVLYKENAEIMRGRIIAASDSLVAVAVDGKAVIIDREGIRFKTKP